jgi:type VI secretion system protein ImpH
METIRELINRVALDLRQGKRSPDFSGLIRGIESKSPELPRIGFAKTPKDEVVRFGQKPALHFTGNDVAEVIPDGGGTDALILSYWLGLLGVDGPMPLEFTNYVFQRSYNHYDNTWRRFLDIIHHRFHTLYYRAFSIYEQAISNDRSNIKDDPVKLLIASLAGSNINYNTSVCNAAQFSQTMRTRSNLEIVLRNMYKVPIAVKDFTLMKLDIPHENHVFLGERSRSLLGKTMQIGRQFWSMTQKFDIFLGPMSYTEYCKFVALGSQLEKLSQTVNLFLDRPLVYDTVFIIHSATIPGTWLGGDPQKSPTRLGVSTWVGKLHNSDLIEHTITISKIMKRKHILSTLKNIDRRVKTAYNLSETGEEED